MRNVWRLFCYDVKNLGANVVTAVIVLGLVFLPSIFTWYNVVACWDVFDHTGNLKVAVANADEGYESDLVPVELNVGEQVVSALRANDQLDWVFTDKDDAIDGARSGAYYAAVVIPESFSRDMMSFFAPETEHASIVYYTNEKKNAVAPRVTDQGADKVAAQINQAFAETLSDVALGLASALNSYVDAGDSGGRIAALSASIADQGRQMADAASLLRSYAQLAHSAQALVGSSTALLGDARGAVDDLGSAAAGGADGAEEVAGALGDAVQGLADALAAADEAFAEVPDAIDEAFAAVGAMSASSSGALRNQAAVVGQRADACAQAAGGLQGALDSGVVPESVRPTVQALADQLSSTAQLLSRLDDALVRAADSIDQGNADAQSQHAELSALADEASQAIAALENDYADNLKPQLDALAATVADALSTLQARSSLLGGVADDLQGSASSVSGRLSEAQGQLESAAAELDALAGKLGDFSRSVDAALATGDVEALRSVLSADVDTVAKAFAAPVGVETHAVFAADNFGSAMTPLYATLALWIGSLLVMVLLNPVPSDRARERLDNPKPWQLFFGRWGVTAVVSLMQSTVLALGCLLFVQVQAVHPLLFLLCFQITGLVFGFIVYTLVSLFANVGKALAVLLLIVQVSGGGGSYPLQVLPDFFQTLSPFLPVTHAANAMRAAMMGVHNGDFWMEMGMVALFVLPFVVLGLMRPLISGLVEAFVRKVEESKLVS